MKALRDLTSVCTKGITTTIFDALVAVARANGYPLYHQKDYPAHKYTDDYITLDSEQGCLQNGYHSGYAISIKDWLFSSAPDWAVDIRVYYNGIFFWTDGRTKVQVIGNNMASHSAEANVVLSRGELVFTTEKPVLKIKEGEKYLWKRMGHIIKMVRVVFQDGDVFAGYCGDKHVAGYCSHLVECEEQENDKRQTILTASSVMAEFSSELNKGTKLGREHFTGCAEALFDAGLLKEATK